VLEWFGYEIISAWLGYKAKNYIEVSDFDKALKIYKMLEDFGNDEDVEWVWNNADINNTLWQEVSEHIESHRFRT
jgi:transcriptional/translational regulatory protein YebC/TACO1